MSGGGEAMLYPYRPAGEHRLPGLRPGGAAGPGALLGLMRESDGLAHTVLAEALELKTCAPLRDDVLPPPESGSRSREVPTFRQ